MQRIVVVGASLAGLRAAEALRREGYAGELVLVGAEPHLPYDRPPLSKQLLQGKLSAERIVLCSGDKAQSLGLTLELGVAASGLDLAARRLQLADRRELAWDGLVIATGASPRRLPFGHELAGVHVLRTLDDARAIADGLAQRPRVCVIGAGFIGLEVAASCRQLGLEVSVVEPEPLPLASKLGPRIAQLLLELHQERGVQFHLGGGVRALEGAGRVERARLADGRALDADLVVVGIGVRPSLDWLAGSGLALGDGVLCDATCATSAPDVVAAGDCARWPNARWDESMRVEHWTHAVEMAGHAARRLLSGASFVEPFNPVPYFWTDQYEHKLQLAGRVRPDDEFVFVEAPTAERKLVGLYGREGKLVGVVAIGRPAQLVRYRGAIAKGVGFEEALASGPRAQDGGSGSGSTSSVG
jgi:3-phenylpropionate/trans-cinnamate dioxygenase ferredoxin reductase subunit